MVENGVRKIFQSASEIAPKEGSMRHRFALLALALPFIGACSSDSSSKASTPSVATSIASAAPAAVTTVPPGAPDTSVETSVAGSAPTGASAVGIAQFKFGPAEVHVPVGGSVMWTNNDPQQHTATSSTGAFDAGTIQPGASATVVFKTAGSFGYICSFHPFMAGTVVVG